MREMLDWASDSRALRLEKRHAARILIRLLRAAQVSDCRWSWETIASTDEDTEAAESEHRLCLHPSAGSERICRDFSSALLVRAANGEPRAEWLVEEKLRELVARAREGARAL